MLLCAHVHPHNMHRRTHARTHAHTCKHTRRHTHDTSREMSNLVSCDEMRSGVLGGGGTTACRSEQHDDVGCCSERSIRSVAVVYAPSRVDGESPGDDAHGPLSERRSAGLYDTQDCSVERLTQFGRCKSCANAAWRLRSICSLCCSARLASAACRFLSISAR